MAVGCPAPKPPPAKVNRASKGPRRNAHQDCQKPGRTRTPDSRSIALAQTCTAANIATAPIAYHVPTAAGNGKAHGG